MVPTETTSEEVTQSNGIVLATVPTDSVTPPTPSPSVMERGRFQEILQRAQAQLTSHMDRLRISPLRSIGQVRRRLNFDQVPLAETSMEREVALSFQRLQRLRAINIRLRRQVRDRRRALDRIRRLLLAQRAQEAPDKVRRPDKQSG